MFKHLKFNKQIIINLVWIIFVFASGLYLINGKQLFGPNSEKDQPDGFFIFLIVFFILSFVGLIIYAIKTKQYKPSRILSIICLGLFIFGMMAIILFPSNKDFSNISVNNENNILIVSNVQKTKYIFQYLGLIALFYLSFDVLIKLFKEFDIIYFFCMLFIFVTLILVVISYFIESANYVNLIKNISKENPYQYTVKSLLPHRNSYGIILFIAMLSSLYLHLKDNKFYWYILDGFFFINLIFTLCKTGLVLYVLFNFSYLLARFFLTYKDFKKRNIIALISFSGSLILIISIALIYLSVLGKLNSFINNFFSSNTLGTIEGRFLLYEGAIKVIGETNIILGCGYKIFGSALSIVTIEHNIYSHNGILELYGAGGIILISFATLFVIYCLYKMIKNFNINKKDNIYTLIVLIISFVYTMVESGSIVFASTIEYTFLSLLIFVPLIKNNFNVSNSQINDSVPFL